ncbi:hypothetical protein [Roseofilum casamattae]|uniref:Uncharacterized protein n=1 Tax=Roseofilum casamattae BLCC-M143 TaxID=3022442 RepID=A0ABT7BXY3_9CYAN|nr:hypothetical protein [Roseofilum casamattae]MDJ1184050.1 hypothetical protein [Roseofilum casamattae BLCC-M143]
MPAGDRHLCHTDLSMTDRVSQTQLSKRAISQPSNSCNEGAEAIPNESLSLESIHHRHMDAVSQLVRDSIISSIKLSISV